MNIAIIGTGYVGLVTGTCFADMGINVTCVDVDASKIEGLKNGIIPIYEPGLKALVLKNANADRLKFSTSLADVIDSVEVIFIAVGTPPDEDGSADLHYVLDVAHTIGKLMNDYKLIVTKSTVPVGTAEKVRHAVYSELEQRGVAPGNTYGIDFDIASNPEFLKEGAAIKDFMSPDRVVVGVDSPRARKLMQKLYRPFLVSSDRILFTDIPSAEMIKYAANAMLATRISFMNEIANLCDLVGANVNMVRKGIGSDHRIGTKFLYPGCGYGGSCFPKDVKAIIHTARQKGYEMRVLTAVEEVNKHQKLILFDKLKKHFNGELAGKRVALWGLAFKPETDDMREAPSLELISAMLEAGMKIRVYDPIAMDECRRRVGDKVEYARDIYDAALEADAVMLVTEWKEFRMPSWGVVYKSMNTAGENHPPLFDGRNIYDRPELESAGFTYYGLGK
ncbi:MAG: UDP-glucose/GDP-mannose dehydrogenase family protein [Muribaculaceae bacterium]|nr:UDP-glucose/GDP-mannose dehydrogenase family protein [Muribaculaceae bacterium]